MTNETTNTTIHSLLKSIVENVDDLKQRLDISIAAIEEGKRNQAIGAICSDAEAYREVALLIDATIVLHRRAG